jgi:hypothetical protein
MVVTCHLLLDGGFDQMQFQKLCGLRVGSHLTIALCVMEFLGCNSDWSLYVNVLMLKIISQNTSLPGIRFGKPVVVNRP